MMALAYHEQRQARFYVLIATLLIIAFISYFLIDKPLAWTMLNLDNSKVHAIFTLITKIGQSVYWLGLFIVLYLMAQFVLNDRRLANSSIFLFMSTVIAGLICDILKYLLGRNRPPLLFTEHLYGFHFFKTQFLMVSFPSGHSTVIGAVMMGCYLLKPKGWPLFLSIALLVGFSRLILTDHFLSDVLVGLSLGATTARVCYLYLARKGYLV